MTRDTYEILETGEVSPQDLDSLWELSEVGGVQQGKCSPNNTTGYYYLYRYPVHSQQTVR